MFDDLIFIGDPHGKVDFIVDLAEKENNKKFIFLGDLCFEEKISKELSFLKKNGHDFFWIHGNNDTEEEKLFNNLFLDKSFNASCLSGKIKEISGIKIAGLGGVFRGGIWNPKKNFVNFYNEEDMKKKNKMSEIPLRHKSSIFPEHVDCFNGKKADILVCHEAPSSHIYGFRVIDELAYELGVSVIVHGHHHVDYNLGLYNVEVYGVGKESFLYGKDIVLKKQILNL